MSEQSTEPTAEGGEGTTVNVEAEQAVVNTAEDGGGVDNNNAPAEDSQE